MNGIKNIFLCTTEYHLFLSLHIVESLYNSDVYESLIVMTTGMRKNVSVYNKSKLTSNTKLIEVDWHDLRTRHFLNRFLNVKCNNFHYYLSHFPVHRYIVRSFSRKGAKIILIQDGLKAYVPQERFNIRQRIGIAYYSILEYINIRDFIGVFDRMNLSIYVNDRHISEVWLSHPQLFEQDSNDSYTVVKIPEFNKHTVAKVSQLFSYELQVDFEPNDILYLTQPYLSAEQKQREILFLKHLLEKERTSKLIIKFHPARSMDRDAFYKELPEACYLNNVNVPAELIIQSLDKVIIMSFCSTALLVNNRSCRFYFLYPILGNGPLCQISNPDLFDHVKVISKVDEVEFYV